MPKLNINESIKSISEKKIRSLSLIVTKKCNLSCTYCYEKDKLRDNTFMDVSLVKEIIKKYMTADDDYDSIQIDFFGGEPLLGFPLIREVVDWFHSQKWKKKHKFLIGTNGTILDSQMKEWLLKYKSCLNIAVSIDGTKKAHDLARDNSYDQVKKNLPFFTENWPHQPAKMTICEKTIPFVAEGVIELEEMGINFSANIGFEDMWGDDQEKEMLLDIYERQLSRLVEYYKERDDLNPVIPIFNPIPLALGLPKLESQKDDTLPLRYCGAGHEMVVIDVDGKPYPCHRFLPWITGKPAPKENANCQIAWKPDECAQCKLITSCPTCAGYNWEVNDDTGIRTKFHCEAYKLEVLASAQLEAIKLRKQLYELDQLSEDEKRKIKLRIEAIFELLDNGI